MSKKHVAKTCIICKEPCGEGSGRDDTIRIKISSKYLEASKLELEQREVEGHEKCFMKAEVLFRYNVEEEDRIECACCEEYNHYDGHCSTLDNYFDQKTSICNFYTPSFVFNLNKLARESIRWRMAWQIAEPKVREFSEKGYKNLVTLLKGEGNHEKNKKYF